MKNSDKLKKKWEKPENTNVHWLEMCIDLATNLK